MHDKKQKSKVGGKVLEKTHRDEKERKKEQTLNVGKLFGTGPVPRKRENGNTALGVEKKKEAGRRKGGRETRLPGPNLGETSLGQKKSIEEASEGTQKGKNEENLLNKGRKKASEKLGARRPGAVF